MIMNDAINNLLLRKEVAAILRVDPKTVSRMWRRGCLPRPVMIGGALRWRMDDLERWLRKR